MFTIASARSAIRSRRLPLQFLAALRQSRSIANNVKAQLNPGLQEALSRPPPKLTNRHVVFSGIQPTGTPHLGNYLGAMRQWKQLVDLCRGTTTQCYFSIVDLHALTTPSRQAADQLQANGRETVMSLLASGLDHEESLVFYQSHVPAHAELMWILSCVASTGQLARMTQWKAKLGLDTKSYESTLDNHPALKLGLFSYPVLQAADVLLYDTTIVPVGEDQRQHIEFARNVAGAFNSVYGETFPVPEACISTVKRVMSLKNPTEKMSKSGPDVGSRILLTDTKQEIMSKVKAAKTDSIQGITYDPRNRPGVSNLLEILYHLQDEPPAGIEQLVKNLNDAGFRMLELKQRVADAIDDKLVPIRESYLEMKSIDEINPARLDETMAHGAYQVRRHAARKMKIVRELLGLKDVTNI